MARLQAKSFSSPDDVRTSQRVRFVTVGLDDATVGYCTFEPGWRAAHNARLREQLNVHRGREVKTTGDGILTVFDSPTRAVGCAAGMVRAARAIGLELRAGVHTGEVELVGDDVRGITVHTAARVLALAGPGEVLVSSTTGGLLEGSGIALEDAGAHELKGLSGPRQLLRLVEPPTA